MLLTGCVSPRTYSRSCFSAYATYSCLKTYYIGDILEPSGPILAPPGLYSSSDRFEFYCDKKIITEYQEAMIKWINCVESDLNEKISNIVKQVENVFSCHLEKRAVCVDVKHELDKDTVIWKEGNLAEISTSDYLPRPPYCVRSQGSVSQILLEFCTADIEMYFKDLKKVKTETLGKISNYTITKIKKNLLIDLILSISKL